VKSGRLTTALSPIKIGPRPITALLTQKARTVWVIDRPAADILATLPAPTPGGVERLPLAEKLLVAGARPADLAKALRRAPLGLPPMPAYCESLRLTDQGVVLGKGTVIAALDDRADGSTGLVIEEDRIVALLAVASGTVSAAGPVVRQFACASRALAKGDPTLAAIALAQLGQPPLEHSGFAKALSLAADALGRGTDPVALLKGLGMVAEGEHWEKAMVATHDASYHAKSIGHFNPTEPRVPEHSPGGGQWTNGIDWGFIGSMEGGQKLKAYVPKTKNGKPIGRSSVTVATGVDLGQQSENNLRDKGVSEELLAKLHPYIGKSYDTIASQFARDGLTLTQDEADQLDHAVREIQTDKIRQQYDNAVDEAGGGKHFDELPSAEQTIIASTAYNMGPGYGTTSRSSAQRKALWGRLVAQDFDGAEGALRRLSDDSSETPGIRHRRKREADYLHVRRARRHQHRPGDPIEA